ncbi:MAG: hypothetical protein WAO55_05555 [Candidatus Manganitrophaceae bacterium]
MKKKPGSGTPVWKKISRPVFHLILGGLLLLVLILLWEFRPKSTVKKPAPPAVPSASEPAKPADPFSPEQLIAAGERVIFGTTSPKFDSNKGVQVGKGQCPVCHVAFEGQPPNRFPRLMEMAARAGGRIREERYEMFARRHEAGEPATGIRPHAKTAGEYLIESIYCPSCYVVERLGVPGTDDRVSPMPVIHHSERVPSDYEMMAIVAYLQAADARGDLSKITARQDWERYFGKKMSLDAVPEETPSPTATSPEELSKIGLSQETPEIIIEKMLCHMCHKIPTVPIAQTGRIGPVLMLKTTAAQRIQSPEYQRALKEGKVRATTPKGYVMESILNPGGFVVPGFDDAMPRHFKKRLTFGAVERLAEFLLTLDEEAAKGAESDPAGTGKGGETGG